MKRAAFLTAALMLQALPGCTAPDGEPAPVGAALWQAEDAAGAIRNASCPAGSTAPQAFQPLEFTAAPLSEAQATAVSSRLPETAWLAGAWTLSAADPNFGGLSGLAVEETGNLLAVTDAGGWVRLGLEKGVPVSAGIAYMLGADGRFLNGKQENDAEGLAYRDGLAFVSFERDFRIEAFALGDCGAKAKAVEIASLPTTFEGRRIDANSGPEALTLTPQGNLRFGYENAGDDTSPMGEVLENGQADWSGDSAANPPGFALVAMDTASLPGGGVREIQLYRAFDPLRGARSVLVWGPGKADRFTLSRPALTDNFEGLAAQGLEDGILRLWIVSDDNFAEVQRTLLYAVDVSVPPGAD